MSEGPAKRRRFRFAYSLRTFLAVVTIIGVFLGWNLHRVRQRQQMLAEIESRGGHYWPGTYDPWSKTSVPIVWAIFGAEHIGGIRLPIRTFSTDERNEVKALFPEAAITRSYYPDDPPSEIPDDFGID